MNEPLALSRYTASTELTLLQEAELQRRQQEFLAAASSENTRRSYRSAIRHFLKWGGQLPCDSGLILRYLLSHAGQLNPRTLALRLTALSQWHKFQGFTDPCEHADIRLSLRGMQRSLGRPARQAQALNPETLNQLLIHFAQNKGIRARRDAALFQIGFYGAFRRSELAALDISDLQFSAEGVVIKLRRSKTDQELKGSYKAIPYAELNSETWAATGLEPSYFCPVLALQAWLADAGLKSGPVFRQINRWQQVSELGLHAGSISQLLKQALASIGTANPQNYSAHSLRRGLATHAHRAGASLQEIKRQGGWRHDATVQMYIEEAKLFSENAASKLLQSNKTIKQTDN